MAEFFKQVSEFATKAKISNERVMRGATIKLFSSVIMATPVNQNPTQHGGGLRANWQLGGSSPASGVVNAFDEGSATASGVSSGVASATNWHEFTLANNKPEASAVEFGGYPKTPKKGSKVSKKGVKPAEYKILSAGGFSSAAPRGMVRVNAARFDAIVEQMARARR